MFWGQCFPILAALMAALRTCEVAVQGPFCVLNFAYLAVAQTMLLEDDF